MASLWLHCVTTQCSEHVYLCCENLTNIPVSLMILIIQMTNFLFVPKISIHSRPVSLLNRGFFRGWTTVKRIWL